MKVEEKAKNFNRRVHKENGEHGEEKRNLT
jgi:hypothetical protein